MSETFKARLKALRDALEKSVKDADAVEKNCDEINKKADQAEEKVDKLENAAAEIEEHIEDITDDLTDITRKKEKAEKELEENRQAVRVLRVRCQMNDAKISRLETELNESNAKNDGIVEECIRKARIIEDLENEQEEKDEYCFQLEKQVKELDSNVVTMDNVLRSMAVNADRADKDLTKSEDRLNEKKKKLKEMLDRAQKAEEMAALLDSKLNDLEEQLEETKDSYKKVKQAQTKFNES